MSDFLRLSDRSGEELVDLVELAVDLELLFSKRLDVDALKGYHLAMWWDGGGFRNRAAFELGAKFLREDLVGKESSPLARGHDLLEQPPPPSGQWSRIVDSLTVRRPTGIIKSAIDFDSETTSSLITILKMPVPVKSQSSLTFFLSQNENEIDKLPD